MTKFITKHGTGSFSESIPVYVTRKTAGGETSSFSVSMWIPLLTMFLFFFNAILWGVIGLVKGVEYLF